MTAVVIDDERPARQFLIALLRAVSEVNVIGEAANGVEAIRLIDDQQPDIAFLDLVLPELDGISLARHLVRRPRPMVVVVTAFDEDERIQDLKPLAVLAKPVNPFQLERVVREARLVLSQQRARVDNRRVRS